MKKILNIIIGLMLISASSNAQTYYSVTNGSGTSPYGPVPVNVTVTPAGITAFSPICFPTQLFVEGNNFSTVGFGQYTWAFSTPVTAIRFSITAIDPGDNVHVYINGLPYCITAANISSFPADCYPDNLAIAVGCNLAPNPPGSGESGATVDINPGYGINSVTITCDGLGNGVGHDFQFTGGGTPPPATPTLSEWGLILFSLLLLSFGMVFVYRRQNAMVLAGAMAEDAKQSSFDRSLYFKALCGVMLVAVAGMFAAYRYFGTLSITDTLGTLASACVVAYMVQLSLLMKRKQD